MMSDEDSPESPESPRSQGSISPIPSPVNLVKDPDFVPPDAEENPPALPSVDPTPVKNPPPAAYDQKIVSGVTFINIPTNNDQLR